MKLTPEFVTALFEIEVMAHIAHLQTTSLSQHLALNELYQAIPELRDNFVEAWQGQNGIVRGYGNVEVKEGVNMVDYLTKKCEEIKEYKSTLTEAYLEQEVENIQRQLYSTLYKLKVLK